MSNKRILPALILAGSVGFLGLHRLYAGRLFTGLLQLVLFIAGAFMLSRNLADVQSLQTFEQIEDWALEHQVQPLPVFLLAIPVFWALIDCGLLLRRQFRDGAGNKIERWV